MSTRRIEPLGAASLQGMTANDIADEALPTVMWVDPCQLLVEESYQRDLAWRSIKLIRKIIAGWTWRKFKPPIVALGEHGYEVIDGQHTAVAAATHPQIDKIPVLVVQATEIKDRADGFLGHNRDRLQITPMQLFHSSVAAGDTVAAEVKMICDQAGVTILRGQTTAHSTNGTLAVGALQQLYKRRGRVNSRRVIEVLARAEPRLISATQLKAVDALLFDLEFKHAGDDAAITAAIKRLGADADREAAVFATTHSITQWRALTIVIYREMRKRRRAA